MEEQKDEKNPDSFGAKRKQRCRNSGSYEKDMNKFLTIIYHNINRLHEEKAPMRKSCSEPHQLELCGKQETPLTENSVCGIHRSGRRHSDFALPLSQLERSNCPKDFKRKVAFADTLTEKARESCSEPHQLELCGTQGLPFMENSVSGIHMSGRRHSDFALPLSQLERSNCTKYFKRKVAFADTLTEKARESCSEPHQLELWGTQGLPFMENSVSGMHMSGRRHSDFALRLSQLERSNCPKDFKRKVAFSDTLTEESNFPL